jgi:hypothetical protein
MLDKLIKLANDLDQRGLVKEAGKVDEILATLTKLVDGIKGSEDSEAGEDESSEEPKAKEDEQVDFDGESTNHFDLCPGAVKAFKMLREQVKNEGVDEDSREVAIDALRATDELLGIEKQILKDESATKDDLKKAIELSYEVAYKAGVLSEKLDSDLSSDFEFLSMHIEAISSHVGKEKE